MLLLDEPFGALDARVRKDLRIWLRRLHDEVHVTTIFVTHDQEEAMDVAEQIVVMNDGRVEQTGEPREIYEHPANEFVMSFIGPGEPARQRVHPARTTSSCMLEPNGSTEEAMIDRIVHLGFEVRVEFSLNDGRQAWAQMTRAEADQLELHEGQIVFVRPDTSKVFTGDGDRRRCAGRRARLVPSPGLRVAGDLVHDRRAARRLATSATVTSSSTARRLARTATHSLPSASAAPPYLTVSGASPRTLASGPSTARMTSAIVISVGRPREPVAALGSALAAHEAGVLQLAEDVLQELERDALGLRQRLSLHRPLAGSGQLGCGPDGIVGLR